MTDTKTLIPEATPERRTFGRLFQPTPGGSWSLRYRIGGRERVESLKTTSKAVAENRAAVIEDRVRRGDHQGADVRRVTFAELEKMLIAHYHVNGLRSMRRVTSALVHLREGFGVMRPAAITKADITTYESDRLTEGASRSTINYEKAMLRKMFNLAIEAERLPSRPKISTPKVKNARTGFFERADLDAVLEYLPAALRPVFTFAFYTGWRVPSEILTLTWDRVDLVARTVRLDPGMTKNGEGRLYPFAAFPELVTLFKQQRADTTAVEREIGAIVPYVFHRDDGAPIRTYQSAWRKACALAATGGKTGKLAAVVRPNVVGRIAHDFRRTAIRNFIRAGMSQHIAMELSGHETPDVFERYNISTEADLSEATEKLAAYLAPKPKRTRKGVSGGLEPSALVVSGGRG